jgi:hypothetical protein
MSIMDFFRSAPATPAQVQNPVPQAAPATNGNPPVPAPTDKSPGGNEPVANPNAPITPNFDTLWDAPAADAPKLPDFNPSAMFTIDPAKIAEAAKGIDYTKAITPEQLTAISQGGEAAMQAFAQAMNSLGQQATQVSMIGAAKLVEQALGKANETMDARVQEQIRKSAVSNSMREKNPVFSSPAFAPMVTAIETQFRTKFPTASAQEITNMAERYVLDFASSVSGKKDADSAAVIESTDWEKLFLS